MQLKTIKPILVAILFLATMTLYGQNGTVNSTEFLQLSKDADQQLQSGQFQKAAETAKKLLQRNPNGYKGYYYEGLALYKLGQKAMARDYLQNAYKLADDNESKTFIEQLIDVINGELNASEFKLKAKQAEVNGDIGDAEEYYYQAFMADNNDFASAKKAADFATRNKNTDRALKIYAICKKSQFVEQATWGKDNLSKLINYSIVNRYRQAATYEEALDGLLLFPDDKMMLGIAMSLSPSIDDALKIFKEFIESDKENLITPSYLILILEYAQAHNISLMKFCNSRKQELIRYIQSKKGEVFAKAVSNYLDKKSYYFDKIVSTSFFAYCQGFSAMVKQNPHPIAFDIDTSSMNISVNTIKPILDIDFNLKLNKYEKKKYSDFDQKGQLTISIAKFYETSFRFGLSVSDYHHFDMDFYTQKIFLSDNNGIVSVLKLPYCVLLTKADINFSLNNSSKITRKAYLSFVVNVETGNVEGVICDWDETKPEGPEKDFISYLSYILNPPILSAGSNYDKLDDYTKLHIDKEFPYYRFSYNEANSYFSSFKSIYLSESLSMVLLTQSSLNTVNEMKKDK